MSTTLQYLQQHLNVSVQEAGWTCPTCGDFFEGDLPDTIEVYDADDLISDITNWAAEGPIEVDTLDRRTRGYTCTFNAVQCGNGHLVYENDIITQDQQYICPECGERWSDAHEASRCCRVHEDDGSEDEEDDTCFTHYFVTMGVDYVTCHCVDGCDQKMCVVCHFESSSFSDMSFHVDVAHPPAVEEEQEEQSYPETVNVGHPATLPPAYEYKAEQPTDCAVCDSEYCCAVHDRHKTPHRGHPG